jgi:hypothetical protein
VDGEGTKVKNTWQLVLIQNKYIRPWRLLAGEDSCRDEALQEEMTASVTREGQWWWLEGESTRQKVMCMRKLKR